ncbi:MAG: DUF2058 domain-containing protein [Shewanella psychromarinicola]|jgi:uncharacterized protein YaiL (DUF2058 family)|uniref:DUF2058 domain-containing protein n=1 Tax=Shewanella psychromarinicola TaxID=2487742 RepID=A0A3N4E3Q2_9GAMM|nr:MULTISPECIES: DUF2058 domain-containing protein [Shewanella]AZG36125.1 DUF2058 domain-containing protein [Shewanella psychromarinicola]MCL1080498.1 DUF2058 domain-containing protein [Shewanella psychromarinicola]PKG77427.1 DUF2058 domain-containing protein [Shewanella sp. Actino-trap-3]RPA31816.1 DUF2058 domain-containing protein [Shewanella psychromarinicola]
MANALQDQLLKAGLASKQKVRDVKTQKKRNKKSKIDDGSDALKQQIAEQKNAQNLKDKALNEQRFAEASEKGQVRGLITEFSKFAITVGKDAEIKFNFTLENKIYSVYITDKIQADLLNGTLGIVRHEEKSYIVPHKLAERVKLLVPQWCGYLWDKAAKDSVEQVSDADDPYANYAIPDDLMW